MSIITEEMALQNEAAIALSKNKMDQKTVKAAKKRAEFDSEAYWAENEKLVVLRKQESHLKSVLGSSEDIADEALKELTLMKSIKQAKEEIALLNKESVIDASKGGAAGGSAMEESEAKEFLRRQIEAEEQNSAHMELINNHNNALREMRLASEQDWHKQRLEAQENANNEMKDMLDFEMDLWNHAAEQEALMIENRKANAHEMLTVYANFGKEMGQSVANAVREGESVFKAAGREMLNLGIDLLERKLLQAEASAVLDAIISGGALSFMSLAKVAAGYTALEAARVGVNSFQSGTDYITQAGPAMVHKGERIISASDNRNLVSVMERIEKKIGNQGGGTYQINAIDSRSFEDFLRRGGNAVIEKQVARGKLAI